MVEGMTINPWEAPYSAPANRETLEFDGRVIRILRRGGSERQRIALGELVDVIVKPARGMLPGSVEFKTHRRLNIRPVVYSKAERDAVEVIVEAIRQRRLHPAPPMPPLPPWQQPPETTPQAYEPGAPVDPWAGHTSA